MRTSYNDIERATRNLCELLDEMTGGIYRGEHGHFQARWNDGGIVFVKDGQTGQNDVIHLTSRNTYEKEQALIAIRDALLLVK